jgi:hypothetical protein
LKSYFVRPDTPEDILLQNIVFLVSFAVMSIITDIAIAWPTSTLTGVVIGAISGIVVPMILWLLSGLVSSITYFHSLQLGDGIPVLWVLVTLTIGVAGASAERILLVFARNPLKLAVAILGSVLLGTACGIMYAMVFSGTYD